jgi:hypothetical protein
LRHDWTDNAERSVTDPLGCTRDGEPNGSKAARRLMNNNANRAADSGCKAGDPDGSDSKRPNHGAPQCSEPSSDTPGQRTQGDRPPPDQGTDGVRGRAQRHSDDVRSGPNGNRDATCKSYEGSRGGSDSESDTPRERANRYGETASQADRRAPHCRERNGSDVCSGAKRHAKSPCQRGEGSPDDRDRSHHQTGSACESAGDPTNTTAHLKREPAAQAKQKRERPKHQSPARRGESGHVTESASDRAPDPPA